MLAKLAPLAVEYNPAEQAIQAALVVWPVPAKYVPAGQFPHAPDELAALAVEYFPAVQVVHTVDPAESEKVPGGQAVQG